MLKFTINLLFDHSQPLVVASNNNAKVTRRQEGQTTYYYKEYVNYHQSSSAQREVMISARLKNLTYVWQAETDKITELRQYLRTKDAGLNVVDWVNIRPLNYPKNPVQPNLTALTGVLQEAIQFVYLIHYCLLALRDIHQAGVVHLDIKPDNICIPANRRNGKLFLEFTSLALIDFDMALSQDIPFITPIELPINNDTNLYQAPRLKAAISEGDLKAQNNLDFGVDLYALGVMLSNILANYGHQLYASSAMPAQSNQSLLNKLQTVIDRLLVFKNSVERTTDTHNSLLQETDKIISQLGVSKTTNSFDFNVNFNQIYDWDKRIAEYNQLETSTTLTNDVQSISESDSSYPYESTDPEILIHGVKNNDAPQPIAAEIVTEANSIHSDSSLTTPAFSIDPDDPFGIKKRQKKSLPIDGVSEAEGKDATSEPIPPERKHRPTSAKAPQKSQRRQPMFIMISLIVITLVGFIAWSQFRTTQPTTTTSANDSTNDSHVDTSSATTNAAIDNAAIDNATDDLDDPIKTEVHSSPQSDANPIPQMKYKETVKTPPTPKPSTPPNNKSNTQSTSDIKPEPEPVQKPVQKPKPQPYPNPESDGINIDDILNSDIVQAPVESSQAPDQTEEDITIDDILSSLE